MRNELLQCTEQIAKNHEIRKKQQAKRYIYNNINFDSSWVASVAKYCDENNIQYEYQPNIRFEYEFNGVTHYYHPDFIINGKIYEVKGDHFIKEDGSWKNPFDHSKDALFNAKYQCAMRHNVIVISIKNLKNLKSIIH